ncbi:MAG: hypothetical protein LBO72_06740 [Helicobacteraceae bacterium]|nr:hypothetical protein [Helicobacteraceae bacterium]
MELEPNYADAYVNRGGVYKESGDIKAAINDALKAKELGDDELYEQLKEENLLQE